MIFFFLQAKLEKIHRTEIAINFSPETFGSFFFSLLPSYYISVKKHNFHYLLVCVVVFFLFTLPSMQSAYLKCFLVCWLSFACTRITGEATDEKKQTNTTRQRHYKKAK